MNAIPLLNPAAKILPFRSKLKTLPYLILKTPFGFAPSLISKNLISPSLEQE